MTCPAPICRRSSDPCGSPAVLRLSDDRFKMGGLVFSTSARRVFDPVAAMAVAVVVGSLWMHSPPAQSSAAARSATIAVELRALAVQTVPVGQSAAESLSVSDAVGADAVDPVQTISGVANLAVTVAGAALWLAAFPITLPATMIADLLLRRGGFFRLLLLQASRSGRVADQWAEHFPRDTEVGGAERDRGLAA